MKILVVGPSKSTRGGITSVIFAHQNFSFWKLNNCIWIESYDDKNSMRKILFFLKAIIKFFVNLRSSQIVYIHIALGTSAVRKFFFFALAKLFNKKIILHFHTPGNAVDIPTDLWKVRYMFKNSNRVIVLANAWKKMIINEFNINNVHVIENPAPLARNSYRKNNSILFLGTLSDRKGYKDLLAAYSKIKNEFRDWKIELCGNGNLKEVENYVIDLGIEKNVIIRGWVNEKERYDALEKASIFCLPSYAEGLPVSVLEALSFKCAILTSPVGGIPDYFESGKDCLLVQPGEVEELTDALKKLMSNEILRDKLVKNSIKIYENYFNPRLIERKINKLIKEL